ncbi:Cobalamin-independent synthase, Catalytic domain [Corynebacterium mycetoides]|uniref:Cobalamin-independent synthase, Catalytic domain n=1 Tax=Corynebacterium mycetoides TaxID=38302 RepID=A0A1G9LYK5_9CORY|nr:methionine synthase [Corynebacterium mycetoides]SDL67102.1 Cobalamin-independent synthase, Catalytic domain [Corynebacterium mycetoides]
MTAFGLGTLPGTDLAKAAEIVLGESPTPHIPQLPERGLGSDLVGRTAALLDIPVDRGPRGWRVATQHRTARDQMARDLDHLEGLWGSVPDVKVQLVGPWTLAAQIEMANGHRMITDPGALRDVTEALLEAVRAHRADVEKRFDARTILQLDEPALADLMAGAIAGATDYETIPAVPEPEERLSLFDAHLLNTTALVDSQWLTVDLDRVRSVPDKDRLAQLVESGTRLAIAPEEPKRVWRFLDELQLDPAGVGLDVWARPAATLTEAAANYRGAREMWEGLG